MTCVEFDRVSAYLRAAPAVLMLAHMSTMFAQDNAEYHRWRTFAGFLLVYVVAAPLLLVATVLWRKVNLRHGAFDMFDILSERECLGLLACMRFVRCMLPCSRVRPC